MADEQVQQDDIQEETLDIPKVGSALMAIAMIWQALKYLHKNAWRQTLIVYILIAFVLWIVTNNMGALGAFAKSIIGLFSGIGG